jgi:uncharacterized membrane protein YoaK (UPF0700 family)
MALSPKDEFGLAVALAGAAGFADAVSYLANGVFAANMTGNTVLAAISLAEGDWPAATERGLTIAAFFLGALAGALVLRAARGRHSAPIGVEAALIVASAILEPRGEGSLLAIAAAMGMQASALTRVGRASVSTVFVTGTLARLARFCATVAASAVERSAEAERTAPLAQFADWAVYGLGAFLAVLALRLTPVPLVAPAALLALLAAATAFRESRREVARQDPRA